MTWTWRKSSDLERFLFDKMKFCLGWYHTLSGKLNFSWQNYLYYAWILAFSDKSLLRYWVLRMQLHLLNIRVFFSSYKEHKYVQQKDGPISIDFPTFSQESLKVSKHSWPKIKKNIKSQKTFLQFSSLSFNVWKYCDLISDRDKPLPFCKQTYCKNKNR